MKINRFESSVEATKEAGEFLSSALVASKGYPTLFLSSGGSSFSILNYVNPKSLGKEVTVTVLDERYVVLPGQSNFSQLRNFAFYENAKMAGCDFISTASSLPKTLDEEGEQFNRNISGWIKNNPDGKIIATVGMGSDGHIAGILPIPEDERFFNRMFDDPKKYAVGYDTRGRGAFKERITSTISLLMRVDVALTFVVGEEKKPALAKLISKETVKTSEFPARVLLEMKDVTVFTDISK